MKLIKYASLFVVILLLNLANAQVGVRIAVPQYNPITAGQDHFHSDIGTEILKMVALDEGWCLHFVSCLPSQCLELLKEGKVDVVPVALETAERRAEFDFSEVSVFNDWPNLIYDSKSSGQVKTLKDIAGKRIAMIKGSNSAISFLETSRQYALPMSYYYVKNSEELIESLNFKLADFAVSSRMIRPFMEELSDSYHITDFMINPYQLKFAVLKGKNHFILERVDKAQRHYRKIENSDYRKLFLKYLNHQIFSRENDWHGLIFAVVGISLIVVVLLSLFLFHRWKKLRLNFDGIEGMVVGARKVKSDFLANMSHEVRTPLNAIMGMTEVLMDSPLSLKQKRHLEMIKGGSENLLVILNDILDLSRIESGDIQVNRYHGDIRKLCVDVMNMVSLRFVGRDLGFTLDVDQGVPRDVVTDHVRLRHILANLISNAGKFTDHGDVYLKVTPVGEDKLLFKVIDTGKGMSKEALDQMFVEFWQEDFSSRKKYGGTGLGLSITKQLVKLLDGKIDVHSVEGVGSTFSITLSVGDLSSYEQSKPPICKVVGQNIAVVTSKIMERDFLCDFYTIKNFACHPFSELSGEFFNQLDSFDLIFIEHNFIYSGKEFNLLTIDRLRPFVSKIVIIYPIGADSILMRDFASYNFLRHVVRPLSKHKICSEMMDVVKASFSDNKKVLIIDDEPDYRLVLEDSIGTHFDLDVVSVGSGQEGLNALKSDDFSLVILDIQMREMTGLEFFNTMKQLDLNIPVLFLSGHYLDENLLENIEGTYLYIDKVDGITEVIKSIEILLEINESVVVEKKSPQLVENVKVVLVIDDSPVNITLIEVMLKGFNYKLVSGENGKEAFELYLEYKPDIILMDLQMPEVDGYQATEKIRKHEIENGVDFPVPILAISAYALENEIARAFQAGCTEYLSKPIKKKQLYSVIDELLKK